METQIPFQLGVLDFLISLPQTQTLAPAVEALGYQRYWIAEHPPQPSPILAAGLVAGITPRLRVGTAAILFRYYSPAKAAYDFQLLEAAYPNRIDAGFGSSGGLSRENPLLADYADGRPNDYFNPAVYQSRIEAFLGYLRHKPSSTVETNQTVWDAAEYAAPEIWVHGNGLGSVACAAEHGLALSISLCHPPYDYDPAHLHTYRETFQAKGALTRPYVSLTVAGLCAETEAHAQTLVANRYLESVFLNIVGTPSRWQDELGRIYERYRPDVITVLDVNGRYEDRLATYTLLAEAFGLNAAAYALPIRSDLGYPAPIPVAA